MAGLRFDRLATLGFFGPISRICSGQKGPRIPILMYHAVRDGRSDSRPYYETNVSPRVFADQMRQLRDGGYRAVSLDQAVRQLPSMDVNQKLVVITFDDGYRDFCEAAFPVLNELQFTATVFLISSATTDQPGQFKGKECLTWTEVRDLHSRGISFGSHTATHPKLDLLGREEVEDEIERSKKTIEDQMGAQVLSFSYPYAFPQANPQFAKYLKDLLKKHGYENTVTTIVGRASASSDPYQLPRLPVNQWDDSRLFQAKLIGGYDWFHTPQYVGKVIKNYVKGDRQ